MSKLWTIVLFLLFFVAFARTYAQNAVSSLDALEATNKKHYVKEIQASKKTPCTSLKLLNDEGEIVFFARVEKDENIGNLLAMAGEALSGQYTMQITKGKLLVSEKIIIGEGLKP
jgi:hypothetical protein